jgi:3-oxoacyl-[acyl-carrier protein] reductase
MSEQVTKSAPGKSVPGKVALVTGASRGIGRAIAMQLAADGYAVAVNYCSSDEKAIAVCADICEKGGLAKPFKADVADAQQVEAMFEQINAQLGPVAVLVNNAGVLQDNYLMMMSENQWDKVIDTNLKGTFLVAQIAVKNMIRARAGHIVNMVSISGLVGTEGQANYAASKGGVIAMTRSMARELGRYNIQVNAIAPGFISTEMIGEMNEKQLDEHKKRIPLKRIGEPEEVGHLVSFVVSDKNRYMTGQTLVLDGGLSV